MERRRIRDFCLNSIIIVVFALTAGCSKDPIKRERFIGSWIVKGDGKKGALLVAGDGTFRATGFPSRAFYNWNGPRFINGRGNWSLVRKGRYQSLSLEWHNLRPPYAFSTIDGQVKSGDALVVEFTVGDPDSLDYVKLEKVNK